MKINHRRKNPKRYPENNKYVPGGARPMNEGVKWHKTGELVPVTDGAYFFDGGNCNMLKNGYAPPDDKPWKYIDTSMHGACDVGELSGVHVGASIGNDFTNGHRGRAKAIRGAKKFVRTRIRFHENAETKKLAQEIDEE